MARGARVPRSPACRSSSEGPPWLLPNGLKCPPIWRVIHAQNPSLLAADAKPEPKIPAVLHPMDKSPHVCTCIPCAPCGSPLQQLQWYRWNLGSQLRQTYGWKATNFADDLTGAFLRFLHNGHHAHCLAATGTTSPLHSYLLKTHKSINAIALDDANGLVLCHDVTGGVKGFF